MLNTAARFRHCLFLAVAAAGGCHYQDHGYFPLHSGAHWEYRLTSSWIDKEEISFYSVTNLRSTMLDGQTTTIRRDNRGTDFYLTRGEHGIARVAKRTVVEPAPRRDPEPRHVLRFPPHPGTEWRVSSHPYLLKRILPFSERFNRDLSLVMQYTVLSTQASVTVPAGHFTGCLLVQGEGTLSLYADAVAGVSEVPVISREWYAPGTGLVRLERREVLNTAQIIGGSATLELLRYRP